MAHNDFFGQDSPGLKPYEHKNGSFLSQLRRFLRLELKTAWELVTFLSLLGIPQGDVTSNLDSAKKPIQSCFFGLFEELRMDGNTCPLCGNTSLKDLYKMGSQSQLCRCRGCRAEFLAPQPTNEELNQEYSGYYEKRSTENFSRPKQDFFKTVLQGELQLDLSGKEVLDIGGGEGDCAAAIKDLWPSSKVTVVESNTENQSFIETQYCQVINSSIDDLVESDSIQQKYDYILMFDLLEHLRHPSKTLQQVSKKLLKGNGEIIASFPNTESLSHNLLGALWPQYKLEHLFYFSTPSVELLAQAASLRTVKLRPLKKRLPVEYLLSVGKNFGPKPLQSITKAFSHITPSMIQRQSVSIGLGESLWVAKHSSGRANDESQI